MGELAIVLGGGAARGAYQVGVLRYVAERYPDLRVPILTGVSAGAINAAFLASQPGNFQERVERLTELWAGLHPEMIFRVDLGSLAKHGLRWLSEVTLLGGRKGVPTVHGLVDTQPLRELLHRTFATESGRLEGIARNLREGDLRAVALTTTDYGTGETVTWCEGSTIDTWNRPLRRAVETSLGVEHIMASAALPLFFPAVEIDACWYGDGGVRLHSPLAPATHLGARRILGVSTRQLASRHELETTRPRGYPQPAQVIGVLFNAVFLDNLEQDEIHMRRINRLLTAGGFEARGRQHHVEIEVVRPSTNLGKLAHEFEPRLPRAFRFLTRRLGTRSQASPDLVSMLMFQNDYLCRLIEHGEADARRRAADIERLIEAS